MKQKISAAFLLMLVMLVFAACALEHYDETNISKLYDETWIIGKTRTEIAEKYGKFDREFVSDEGKILGAYYVNYDNGWIDPSYIHDTYFIEFDGEDTAIDAWFAQTSIGG